MSELVRVDGAIGGGQILRSALSLSALNGRAFAIDRIRKQRERPGLMRQHLTAVRAAAHMPSRGAKRTRSGVSRQQPRT